MRNFGKLTNTFQGAFPVIWICLQTLNSCITISSSIAIVIKFCTCLSLYMDVSMDRAVSMHQGPLAWTVGALLKQLQII